MNIIARHIARATSIIAVCATLLLTGCHTTKPKTEVPQRVSTKSDVFRTLSIDKATFSLTLSGTEMNASGSIRIARDSVIICSIMPLPGMEFFRFGINKTGIVILNRVDKKYVTVSYKEMHDKGMRLNYQTFEAIFTNRLFLYGEEYFPLASDFQQAQANGGVQLQRTDGDVLQEFAFDAAKHLVSGALTMGSQFATRWSYSDFKALNACSVPHKVTFSIQKGPEKRTIGVEYDKIDLDKDRNFELKIPSTYEKISMKEFLDLY